MDSAGILLQNHGCSNVQKCSKAKNSKPQTNNPSVSPKRLCGLVFRRNNDNRVYRSESFRFIHKNDAFLPIGRASARSLEIPVSENYVDPVDHQLRGPDEPPYNEIVEKYNAPYYYSDTIKESKEPEPPYCSPCPAERRIYSNHHNRKSWKTKQDRNLQIFKSTAERWPICDQVLDSSSPPNSPLDNNIVDSLIEPVKTIKLEVNDGIKPAVPIRRSHFVSICRIENSPNGTLTNFSVLSDGEHGQQQQLRSCESQYNISVQKKYEKALDTESQGVNKSAYYRSFRVPHIGKNGSCDSCGKLQSAVIVPVVTDKDCSKMCRDTLPVNDAFVDRYRGFSDPDTAQTAKDGDLPGVVYNNHGVIAVCEGNTEIVSCCPYHPLRIYSNYNGLKKEEILWPVNSNIDVPGGYQSSHLYSQVSGTAGCPALRSSSGTLSSVTGVRNKHYPNGRCHYGSTSSSSTSSTGASDSTIVNDIPVDFLNSDNNYLKSLHLKSSEYKCQIRQYPFNIDVPLQNQDWFHGVMTRAQSEKILQSACEGSFLVRNCEQSPRSHYSLSIRSSNGFIHIRIEPNSVGTYTLGEQEFPSVPYLIHHFMLSRLPIKGEEHVKLMHPVITQFL